MTKFYAVKHRYVNTENADTIQTKADLELFIKKGDYGTIQNSNY